MAWNEPGGNDNKDPWGHRKKEEPGPPDLEELVQKMQDKLGSWFGGEGGSSKPPESGGETSLSWTFLFIIAFFLLIIWGLFGLFMVQPAEQGLVMRFNAFQRVSSPGLNWHIPYPIERVEKINIEQVQAVSHKAIMLTQDENIVEIELVVQYRVKDAKDYLFNVRDPDHTLQQATESALREIIGTNKMDEVLTSKRDEVAMQTKAVIQIIVDRYSTGLHVTSVNMQNAQPPKEVQEAFADVIKAREDEEQYKNKAEAYSNEVKERAGGASDKLRQEAQAYKAQVVAHAEGETKRFLSVLTEYEKAPEITRHRLYLETMETVLANTRKIMINTPSNNNLMVFPLDRLLGETSSGLSSSTTSTNPSGLMSAPTLLPADSASGPRNPDDLRSRGGR